MKKLRLKYASSLLLASALLTSPATVSAASRPLKALLTAVILYAASSSNEFTANEFTPNSDSAIQSSSNSGFTRVETQNEYSSPANGVANEQSILGYSHIQRKAHNKMQYGLSRVEEAKEFATMYTEGYGLDEFLQAGIQPHQLFSSEFKEMSLGRPRVRFIQHRRRLQVNTTTTLTPNATLNGTTTTTTTLAANTTANTTTSTTEDDSSSDSFEKFLEDLGHEDYSKTENILIFTAFLAGGCILLLCADAVLVWGCKQDCAPDKCSGCCRDNCNWDTCCNKFSCGTCADCEACCTKFPLCGVFCVGCCTSCYACCPTSCKEGFGCEKCCSAQQAENQPLDNQPVNDDTTTQAETELQVDQGRTQAVITGNMTVYGAKVQVNN